MKLDPITIEIFFHKFTAITEEMAITLQRSARTTYVKEAGDLPNSKENLLQRFTTNKGPEPVRKFAIRLVNHHLFWDPFRDLRNIPVV